MKTLILLAVVFLPVAYVLDSLRTAGTVRAQSVEQASANLSKTERDLRTTAASTGAQQRRTHVKPLSAFNTGGHSWMILLSAHEGILLMPDVPMLWSKVDGARRRHLCTRSETLSSPQECSNPNT